MKKIKTSELTGAALDWAVAKCEGVKVHKFKESPSLFMGDGLDKFKPSTDWAQGGPIIEREGIRIDQDYETKEWFCISCVGNDEWIVGPTPLIAAMRCYVTSKLGDEVEIPEELISCGKKQLTLVVGAGKTKAKGIIS